MNFSNYKNYAKVFLRRLNPKNSKVTHFFIGLNLATFIVSKTDKELLDRFFYDPWDKYKYIFDDKLKPEDDLEKSVEFAKNLAKIGITMNYPKNERELGLTTASLWLFSRPMELLLGSKLVALTYITSHIFTFFCFLPISTNTIKNTTDMNPYVFSFSIGSALLFNFTGATRCFRVLSILSWVPFLYIFFNSFHDSYEIRPIFLTALVMSLYIKYRFRVY